MLSLFLLSTVSAVLILGVPLDVANATANQDSHGANNTTRCSNCTISITTSTADVLVCVFVNTLTNSRTESAVGDAHSLAWTQRKDYHADGWYEYCAPSASQLTSDLFYVTLSSSASTSIFWLGLAGTNINDYPDWGGSSSQCTGYGTSATPGCTIATSNANDIVFGVVFSKATPTISAGSGFVSLVDQIGYAADELEVVSSTQAGVTVGFNYNMSDGWYVVFDSVEAMPVTSGTVVAASPYDVANIPMGVANPLEQKSFYDNTYGLWYQFYVGQNGMNCESTPEASAVTWSAPVQITSIEDQEFNVAFNQSSEQLFFVQTHGLSAFYYRAGTLGSGGCAGISWSFAQTPVTVNGTSPAVSAPSTAWDSKGDLWLVVSVAANSGSHYEQIYECVKPASTTCFGGAVERSYHMAVTSGAEIIGLTAGKMMLISGCTGSCAGVLTFTHFDGSSWSGTTGVTPSSPSNQFLISQGRGIAPIYPANAVPASDTVYVSGGSSSHNSGALYFFSCAYPCTGTLSAATAIVSASVDASTISTDGEDLWVFYNYANLTTVKYLKSTNLGSTWGSQVTVSNAELNYGTIALGTFWYPQNNYLGVYWEEGTATTGNGQGGCGSAPYCYIRFAVVGAPSQVTVPAMCPMSNSAPAATVTLTVSFGSIDGLSSVTQSCNGAMVNHLVNPSVTVTATEPSDGANTADRFKVGGSPSTTTTDASCPTGPICTTWSFTNYYLLTRYYRMTPGTPATWDKAYSEPVTGTLLGVSNTVGCSVSLANGGGYAQCTGQFDYSTTVLFTYSFVSSGATSWVAQGTYTFIDTTGGGTDNVNYNKISSTVTEEVTFTISPTGAPNQGAVAVSGCATTTVPIDGTQYVFSATPSTTCTYTVSSAGSNSRDQFSGGNTWAYTSGASGTDVKTNTVFHQGKMSAWYTVSGGGSPTAPTLTYTYLGGTGTTYTMTTTPTSEWLDWQTTYSLTNPTTGSTSTHRYAAGSGTSNMPEVDGGTISPTYYNQYLLSGVSTSLSATRTSFGISGVVTTNDWYDSGTGPSVSGINVVVYPASTSPFYVSQVCGDGTQLVTNVSATSVTCLEGKITYSATSAANTFFLPSGGTITNWYAGGTSLFGSVTLKSVSSGTLYLLSGSSSAWEIDYSVPPASTGGNQGGNPGQGIYTVTATPTNTYVVSTGSSASSSSPTSQNVQQLDNVTLFGVGCIVVVVGGSAVYREYDKHKKPRWSKH